MRFWTRLRENTRKVFDFFKRKPGPDEFLIDLEAIPPRKLSTRKLSKGSKKLFDRFSFRNVLFMALGAFILGFVLFFALGKLTGGYRSGIKIYRNEVLEVLNKASYLYREGKVQESERLLSTLFDKELPKDLMYEVGMRLAAIYLEEGKYSLSEITLLKIRDYGRKKGEFHALLGEVYSKMGKYPRAIEEYSTALKLMPSDKVKMNYALVSMKMGDYEKAISLLSSIKKPSPKVLYNLALAYYRAGASEAALNTLKRIKTELVSDLKLKKNILLLESVIHTEKGDVEKSVFSLERMKEQFQDDPEVLYNLGTAYLKTGQVEKAYKVLSRAFELKPDKKVGKALIKVSLSLGMKQEALKVYREISAGDPHLLFEYANLLFQVGKPRRALKIYMEALDGARDPELKAKILANLGSVSDLLGNSEEAINYLKEALKLKDDPLFRYNLAIALKNAGKPVEAIQQLKRVIQDSPHMVDAWRLLAQLLSTRGEQKEALVILRRAVRYNPDSAVLHLELARLYKAMGLMDKSLTEYDLASAGSSVRLTALLEKGVLLMNMGRFNEAVSVLNKVVEEFPSSPEARYDLALAYIKVGYLTFAEDQLKQAKNLTKDKKLLSKIYSSLGHIEYKKGNLDQAKAYYEKALSLDSTNANARVNYRIIKRQLELSGG